MYIKNKSNSKPKPNLNERFVTYRIETKILRENLVWPITFQSKSNFWYEKLSTVVL